MNGMRASGVRRSRNSTDREDANTVLSATDQRASRFRLRSVSPNT